MVTLVRTSGELCFLEIGIPTFNRSVTLYRLLSILQAELNALPTGVSVRVTVSDNHSHDGTPTMLQREFRS